MRFAASRRKPARIYAHGNTRWQQSCSHSTAICNHRFKTLELRTQEQPPVAEHRGGTPSRLKRPQPHPPHTRGTFHCRPQPLYTEKHKLSCSCFLPNTSPMQHSRSHYNAFRRITSQTCTDLRTWQHQMTTIMQPFHCDLQPQGQDTHRTTHTGTTTRCRTQRRNTFAAETIGRTRRTHKVPFIAGRSHFTRKNKLSCSCFLPNTSPTQHSCSPLQSHHFPKSPLPKVTTSHRHHRHHFPPSPLPFVTTSLSHHFPSSSLPLVTTSLPHHFPSSPLPLVTTSQSHHFPSFTTSLPHYFPSSPFP